MVLPVGLHGLTGPFPPKSRGTARPYLPRALLIYSIMVVYAGRAMKPPALTRLEKWEIAALALIAIVMLAFKWWAWVHPESELARCGIWCVVGQHTGSIS